MGLIGSIFGEVASTGVSATLNGVGDAAIKLRSAITGDLPPEKKAELELRYAELDKAITEARSNVVMAEAQGQGWLQRNWRPLLMLVIIVIVANNYILYPYLSIFTDKVRVLDLPDRLWQLMEIGVGGYILGRTAEKMKGAD